MKIFENYLFRSALTLTVFCATVFCPLYFGIPKMTTEISKLILGAVTVILAAVEGVVFTYINYKMLIAPIRTINSTSKKLTGGDYKSKTDLKIADREVKQLAKTTNKIADEFNDLEQMRKSFVANASHELRSPLTSMQGFVQAILDGTIPPEESEKYLKIVLNETKRLNSLITSMLDLSRMESGKNPVSPIKFELNAAISQVIEKFETNLVKKELQLDVDFAEDSSYVFADKDKIIQVLVNLIDNAIKYSPAYSRILVTTHLHGKKIYVAVKDQGFGISKKDQTLIWDKFYMADKAHTPYKNKGTGLGLSIVKKIIDDHNEAIWVESNKGAGATFIFTLSLYDATAKSHSKV